MLSSDDIAQALLQDRSKANVDRLVQAMAKEHFDLSSYLQKVKEAEEPLNWYLTWTLNHYFDRYPHLSGEKQRLVWEGLRSIEHNGIHRDLWRIMSCLEVHEDLAGEIFERAMQVTQSVYQQVAVRAHAMKVLLNITRRYPELVNELDVVLRELMSEESPGLRARAKNYLKDIRRIKELR